MAIIDEYSSNAAAEILNKLKAFGTDYLEIIETSYIVSSSGIGQNVMMAIKVRMKERKFEKIEQELCFDITNYSNW